MTIISAMMVVMVVFLLVMVGSMLYGVVVVVVVVVVFVVLAVICGSGGGGIYDTPCAIQAKSFISSSVLWLSNDIISADAAICSISLCGVGGGRLRLLTACNDGNVGVWACN